MKGWWRECILTIIEVELCQFITHRPVCYIKTIANRLHRWHTFGRINLPSILYIQCFHQSLYNHDNEIDVILILFWIIRTILFLVHTFANYLFLVMYEHSRALRCIDESENIKFQCIVFHDPQIKLNKQNLPVHSVKVKTVLQVCGQMTQARFAQCQSNEAQSWLMGPFHQRFSSAIQAQFCCGLGHILILLQKCVRDVKGFFVRACAAIRVDMLIGVGTKVGRISIEFEFV